MLAARPKALLTVPSRVQRDPPLLDNHESDGKVKHPM